MIELVEASASSDVFSVLKRVDEKSVTEKAFSNPKFVEDIVRDVAQKLKEVVKKITKYQLMIHVFEKNMVPLLINLKRKLKDQNLLMQKNRIIMIGIWLSLQRKTWKASFKK